MTRNPNSKPRLRRPKSCPERISPRKAKHLRDALVAHFDDRQRRLDVVATTRTNTGQIVDWVPRDSQIRGTLATPPEDTREALPGRHRWVRLAVRPWLSKAPN